MRAKAYTALLLGRRAGPITKEHTLQMVLVDLAESMKCQG